MWTAFVSKFYSILFAVLMAFNALSFSLPGIGASADVTYTFSDALPGNAGGTVRVAAKLPGTYQLYWGDDAGDRLTAEIGGAEIPYTEFGEVTVSDGAGEAEIYDYIAIPEGAGTVLVYQGALERGSMEIPAEKQAENGEVLYTFGSISDVHFNRYNASLTGDDSRITFRNALDFYKKAGVSLVAHSGDICTKGEEDSLKKYHEIAADYDFPVYSCTGNHDVGYDPIWDLWVKYINPDVYGNPDRADVTLAENGIDFVYRPESFGGDVFVFLSQRYWDYNKPESRLLDDAQLDWLEAVLEQYQNTRVFLYFHTFLADDGGDPTMGEGNLLTENGVYYDLCYTVGTPDEVRLKGLMKTYKNVIFFNGHSHWDFDSFAFNPRLNITSYGGTWATFVHNPSVSSPRSVTADAKKRTELNMRSSQGYLVRVYADKIVLTGVEFWGTRFVSYATFNIYT